MPEKQNPLNPLQGSTTAGHAEETSPAENKTEFTVYDGTKPTATSFVGQPYGLGKPHRVTVRGNISRD